MSRVAAATLIVRGGFAEGGGVTITGMGGGAGVALSDLSPVAFSAPTVPTRPCWSSI